MDSVVKNLPANVGVWFQSMGQEDSLEKEMVTQSSILAWKILWTEEPESDMTEHMTHSTICLYLQKQVTEGLP